MLRFLLQSPDDPSLLVTAAEVWSTKGRRLAKLGRAFRDPQESLLEALGRAARLFPPIGSRAERGQARGAGAATPAAAWQFSSDGAPALAEAGFGVIVPAELTAAGQRRLRLRMRVTGGRSVAGAVSGAAGLDLDELLSVPVGGGARRPDAHAHESSGRWPSTRRRWFAIAGSGWPSIRVSSPS